MEKNLNMHPALYWQEGKTGTGKVQCLLCPHACSIPEGETGLCRVRKNHEGQLFSLNYGEITAAALDPVEKKPLKRFAPGTNVLSLGTFGCNFNCGFCQNWTIAQAEAPASQYLPPREAVSRARELTDKKNIGLAYTYSEPLMWYEYVLDTARLAREAGLKNILVTNGYINPLPLKELLPYIDAINLDVKAFTEDFYHTVCRGRLAPVLAAAGIMAEYCHLEITTLLVTGLNDSPREIESLASWVASLDRRIPLHLTRYFPNYKLDLPPTPPEVMQKAKQAAEKHLTYVYLGNI